MFKTDIRLADRHIAIDCLYMQTLLLCDDYKISADASTPPDIVVKTTHADIKQEGETSERKKDGPTRHAPGYLETLAVYRQIADAMPSFDTFLMHGAVVSDGTDAYMFIAPSGVGKTTRMRMFLDLVPGSFVINGDKPLLRIEREPQPRAVVYGTPWCGKEGLNTNTSAPLKAIFILERTKEGEKASVTPITSTAGFVRLLRQTYLPSNEETTSKIMNLLGILSSAVGLYLFRSTLDPADVQKAYEIASRAV